MSPRERLIETARRLFHQEGFHATGIDRVLAEAGVAKMTLYKHFRSKDDLILAALRREDEVLRARLAAAVDRRAATPEDRLIAVFDVLAEELTATLCNGCGFAHAAAEFAAPEHPAHAAAAEHKRLVLLWLADLAAAAGLDAPQEAAAGLLLLMDGAVAAWHLRRDAEAPRRAKALARLLLDAAARRPA